MRGQQRQVGRLLRRIDRHIVFAVIGVMMYIIVVGLIAESISVGIRDRARRAQQASVAEGEAINGRPSLSPPPSVLWPYGWPDNPIAEVHLLKEAMTYITSSLTSAYGFFAHLPAAKLDAMDLLLLTDVRVDAAPAVRELRNVVTALWGGATAAPSMQVASATEEALQSILTVLTLKGRASEANEVRDVLVNMLGKGYAKEVTERSPSRAAAASSSWSAFCHSAWMHRLVHGSLNSTDVAALYNTILSVSQGQQRTPGHRLPTLPLHEARLLPIYAGSHDAVVPLARLLLHLWVLGGQEDMHLLTAYDTAVETLLQTLVWTRTIPVGPDAVNITFIGSMAESRVPVATPRTCSVGAMLAQGVRYGAHRYAARPASAQFSENDVLQAAEALAASCFQLYAEPLGRSKLRSAIYFTDSGAVPGFVRAASGRDSSAVRVDYCDIPAILLDTFHELYLTTHDAMYGLWALLVMRQDTSDHCAVQKGALGTSELWQRYLRELRSLWLLFHRMDCLLYRRSRGSRGICDLSSTTIVSPFTGHLIAVKASRSTS